MELAVTIHSVSQLYETIFDSDSSEDEALSDHYYRLVNSRKRKRRTCRVPPCRMKLFFEVTIPGSSDKEFQEDFRLNRAQFSRVLDLVKPLLESDCSVGRSRINAEKQLLCTLWLLATPDSFRSVGKKFDMGKSSIFISFYRVIKALNCIAPSVIKWPNAVEREENSREFRKLGRIPGVIGVVDGSYVPIKAPVDQPEVYVNRKCFHAITLQGICDQHLRFINCFAGFPSSVSDARVFKNSAIHCEMETKFENYFSEQQFIIGDKMYHPVCKFCIPPYYERGHVTARQLNFNKRMASTRQVIERAFALLFGRFRRLRDLNMSRTDLIPHTIIACCVLHNLCLAGEQLLDDYVKEGTAFLKKMQACFHNSNQNLNIQNTGAVHNDDNRSSTDKCGTALRDLIAANLPLSDLM